jgi:hypothetical protein
MVISQLISKMNKENHSSSVSELFIYLSILFSTANDIYQTDYFNFIKFQIYLMVNILLFFILFEDWTFYSKKYAVEFVFSFGLILNNDDS